VKAATRLLLRFRTRVSCFLLTVYSCASWTTRKQRFFRRAKDDIELTPCHTPSGQSSVEFHVFLHH
jgi:hypothetical protein